MEKEISFERQVQFQSPDSSLDKSKVICIYCLCELSDHLRPSSHKLATARWPSVQLTLSQLLTGMIPEVCFI